MKRRFLYLTVFAMLFSVFEVYAQSNTRGTTADTAAKRLANSYNTENTGHRILLIPFYPQMCMSEIDKDVNASTHLDYKQITEAFRRQMDLAMYRTLTKNYVPVSILQGKYKSDSVLSYIYASTGYKYDLVPGVAPDIGGNGKKNSKGLYVQKGELEVPVDYSKRFMNVTISNPKLLSNLYSRYHTDTFVFINELDIKNVDNPTDNLSDETYRRQVTVHYCVMDKSGKTVAKGLATTYFPYRENSPKQIGEKYFSIIAHSILKDYKQGLTINSVSDQQKKQAEATNMMPR